MSHIVSFEIDGLAGRESVYARSLDRHLNAFFGLNGAGKTSLLRILHSAMKGDASLITDVSFKRASVTIYSQMEQRSFTYALERKPGEEDEGEAFIVVDGRAVVQRRGPSNWQCIDSNDHVESRSWHHQYLPTTRIFRLTGHRPPTEDWDRSFDEGFEHLLRDYWVTFFSELQEQARLAQQRGLARVLNAALASPKNIELNASPAEDTRDAYNKVSMFLSRQSPYEPTVDFHAFADRFADDALFRAIVEDIVAVEDEIADIMRPRTRLAELLHRFMGKKKIVALGPSDIRITTHDKKPLALRTISSGEKHILLLLIAVLQADLSTVIIDEPEISMHVDWQETLVDAMRTLNPKAQIVIATHSPEVLAGVPDNLIHRL